MTIKRHLHNLATRYVPSPLFHAAGGLYYRLRDSRTGAAGKPPRHLSFVYGYDPGFDTIGREFRQYFTDLCGLRPDHDVLDVGCGIGRCAMALTDVLSSEGSYRGFDIRKDGIDWCREHITTRFPHFEFQHVDLRNPTYHPGAGDSPDEFTFPYPEDAFDLVFTKSVFTHLRSPVIHRYLQETRRVLKPGGHCLHTFFLLNDRSLRGQAEGTSQFDFRYRVEHGAAVSRTEPEKAIAFEEDHILDLYQEAGLRIVSPLHYGKWSGRDDGLSGQDIIVAVNDAASDES